MSAPSTSRVRRIHKDSSFAAVAPNLPDYERARADFSWAGARAALDGLPGGRGSTSPTRRSTGTSPPAAASACAIRWLGRRARGATSPTRTSRGRSSRFANVLAAWASKPGERVFACCGRMPELYVAALGTLKPAPSSARCSRRSGPSRCGSGSRSATAEVLVTTAALYRRRSRRCATSSRTSSTCSSSSRGRRRRRRRAGPRAAARPHDAPTSRSRRPIRGPGAAALHQRHHRHAEGRGARARGRRRPPRHRPPARSTCTRTTSSGARPTRAG